MSEVIVVYGAGGHGKVVADAWLASGGELLGFIDDAAGPHEMILGLPVLGDGSWLLANRPGPVALGVGENGARERVAARCLSAGLQLVAVIHPAATIAATARVGEGAVVFARAVVNPDAVIERGAIVNSGAVVEHDCVLGAFAHLSPGATLGGAARLGARAHVGLNAAVLPGVEVGEDSIVGAGAAVVRSLPPRVVAVGVPARIVRERP